MRIPATIVTGFLGAGKTTLIRRLIEQADGQRIALIVNEFGDIGIDGDMLASCGEQGCSADDIIELANGCICCTVADDFLPSMQALLARTPSPEHIIIETSGLALPQPLVQAFAWPDIHGKVMLDSVVAVVDGEALDGGGVVCDAEALAAQRLSDPGLDHETPIDALFHDQINAANIIVVSKVDKLSAKAGAGVIANLEKMTQATPVLALADDTAQLKAIFGLGLEEEAFARSQDTHHHHHEHEHEHDDDHDAHEHNHDHDHGHDHGHDAFTSVVVRLSPLADHEAFIARLSQEAATYGLLRAKGFVAVEGKALPLVIQAVGGRIESYFGGALKDNESRLVLIGLADSDMAGLVARLGGEILGGNG